ncbi:MAG: DUF1476 domain-containing protein [Rhodospirillaceae bacterium]|nr:DUF1476 domain-containing protein [Rhodospirillaceae bacterium]
MPSFDDREKAFEAKYRQDQEFRFRVNARRNKLLGEWAGGLMGLKGVAVENYAKDVVSSDFEKPGDSDVVEKVLKDLTAHGVKTDEHTICREMERLLAVARDQIGGKPA